MVERDNKVIGVARQCELLDIARSSIYYQSSPIEKNDTIVMNEIRDIYAKTPFYGYRRIAVSLRQQGIVINHKRLQSLLVIAGIKAVYPAKKTTIRNLAHKIYPYLLRGLLINRPNQAWQVDITYIKIRHGFVYLICLIDVFSRKIMGWSLSTFLDTPPCLEALDRAIKNGRPEIVNSDQGCQFTSASWIERLTKENIKISMDGKGRWVDNVFVERLWRTIKYESVFLHSFDTVDQARSNLANFINFYNQQRYHQSLNYHTPDAIYTRGFIPSKKELFLSFDLYQRTKQPGEIMIPKYT